MRSFSGRERIEAVLAGKDSDRAPIMMWRHFPVDDVSGLELAKSTLAFQSQFESDVVKVTPAQTLFPEMWGGESAYTGDSLGTRSFLRRAVNSLDDWDLLLAMKPNPMPLEVQIEAVQRTRAELGAEAVIVGTVFSPLSVFRYLCGDDLFAPSLRCRPQHSHEMLDIITEEILLASRRLLGAGCDGLFVSLFPAGAAYLSLAEYREFGEPGDRAVLAECTDSFFTLAHFHAPYPWLEFARDYACHGVSWDAWSTSPGIDAVRAATGEKVLVGGLDQRSVLLSGTAMDVHAAVQELARRPSNDLIVAPGCAMPQTIPPGNLRAVFEEVIACGKGVT